MPYVLSIQKLDREPFECYVTETNMSKNLIKNGGFETRSFEHWTVSNYGTPANVVFHNRSYQAQMQPGQDTGQLLFTRFNAQSGPFTLTIDASAPHAKYVNEPPYVETHPLLVFFFSGFTQNGELIQTDLGMWWLTHEQKRFQYNGSMFPDVVSVEVRFSFPSDPLQVKGPLYIDNVSYTLNDSAPHQTLRWSR